MTLIQILNTRAQSKPQPLRKFELRTFRMIIQLEDITWHVESDSNHAESSPFDFFDTSVVIVRKDSLCLMMNDAYFLWHIYQFVWNVSFTVTQAKTHEWKRRCLELKRYIYIDLSMNFFWTTMRTNERNSKTRTVRAIAQSDETNDDVWSAEVWKQQV